MSRVTLLLTALGLTLAGAPAGAQGAPDLSVSTVRFYRQDVGKTLVKVFVQVPYALMEAPGGQSELSYRIGMRVMDSTGLTLSNESWAKHAPAQMKRPGAYGLEQVEFPVAPGRYRLEVTVTDSVSGHTAKADTDFRGWTSTPVVSDLLLSPRMRVAEAADTVPSPGEFRTGTTLVTAAARLRLTPLRASAFYLLEAYNPAAEEATGTIGVAVIDSTGKTLLQTPASPIRVPAGGGVLKGQVNLEGLPEGRYTMKVQVALADTSASRQAAFSMAPLDETLERQVARREASQPAAATDSAYFGRMDAAQLDSAFEPLGLIAKSSELKVWNSGLSVDAKRRFLTGFWQQRDPSPGTGVNQARRQFYGLLAHANATYADRDVPGWKTDRGRIFVKYGAPDEIWRRPVSGQIPAYEIWRYTRGRYRWFIFADRTGFHNFKLMTSNDLQDGGVPDWREIMTEDGVKEAGQYLGVDFYSGRSSVNF